MPDIKRPNYFTSQFLVEADFNDEQAYHLNARRRHNRLLHTSGVAAGLDVTFVNATQVQVGAGTAIDNGGREIVLADAQTYTLVTAGNDLDVYLTIAYQDVLDPADHETQAGLDKFTRTTERPLVQDGTAVPPADGSVIVLARIHLNSAGAIGANSSIDPSVRAVASAEVAPKAVTTAQLADGAVTLAKLANEAQPLAVQGANAITVVTDNTLKRITIGESHSARGDNPHATTAAQIDTQNGPNQLVTQINAGTGVITRSRLESTVVSGVVTFQNLGVGMEMFSDDIDPGFGVGALCVQLALDDAPAVNLTLGGDTNYSRTVQFRSEINRTTGHFRIFVTRNLFSAAGTVSVRWYAFKPQVAVDGGVAIGVAVTPNAASLITGATQGFTAVVSNTTNTGVTWSITEPNGGSLSAITPTSATYTPSAISGTYHVVATSVSDPTKKATVAVVVNADITVTITPPAVGTLFRGASTGLNATVVNTPNTGVTWSVQQGAAGGSVAPNAGATTTYTAPVVPGTYTVVATSVADPTKKATCTITVPAVAISIAPDSFTVGTGSSTTVRATLSGTDELKANWSVGSPVVSVSPATGATTTFFAPDVGGVFSVTGTSVADPTKSDTINITVPNRKDPQGEGKFGPIVEQSPVTNAPAREPSQIVDEHVSVGATVRAFVRPKKRPSAKLPPRPKGKHGKRGKPR